MVRTGFHAKDNENLVTDFKQGNNMTNDLTMNVLNVLGALRG